MSTTTKREMNSAEALKAVDAGQRVLRHTPFRTNADLLVDEEYETSDRIGSVSLADPKGGVRVGDRVRVTPNATAIEWRAGHRYIVPHPAAGLAGCVRCFEKCGDDIFSMCVHLEVDVLGPCGPVPLDWLSFDR